MSIPRFTAQDIWWCQNMFHMLALGGVWAVPRNGLLFEKTSEDPKVMVLKSTDAMRGFSVEFQREELQVIQAAFAEAGIEVQGEIE